MGKVSFYINGLNRKNLQKWVRRAKPGILGSPIALLVAAGIGGMIILDKTLPDLVSLLSGAKVANVGCVPVLGQEIALVVDVSYSMDTTERQTILKTQIKIMEEKGMKIIKYEVYGMGTADNNSKNLLKELRNIFSKRGKKSPDTIFGLSDFEKYDESDPEKKPLEYWETPGKGYAELNEILTQKNVRLYLGSVKFLPSVVMPRLFSIAERSGGGEINFAVLKDGKSLCF